MTAVSVLVLADTHLKADTLHKLPASVVDAATRADLILHAGDIVTTSVLDELGRHAPVHAVLGNNDDAELAARLPETLTLEIESVAVAMIHDSGATAGRERRMRRRFPDAAIVVFGHSHAPVNDSDAGQVLFNPGSSTQRRRQPVATYGWLVLADGSIVERSVVEV